MMRGLTAIHRGPSLPFLLGSALLAAVSAALLVRSPVLAALGVGALAVAVTAARFGVVAIVASAFALLPWLVILEGKLPGEVATFTAAIAAGSLLAMAWPLRFNSVVIPVASFIWVAIVLGHLVFATEFDQVIQACKYMVFPAMALAVTSERGHELAVRLGVPVLVSGLAAMVFHLGVVVAGLGASSTYYGAGEKLGFAAEGPHALALISMIMAAAGLTVGGQPALRAALFTLGATAAALSGVRSALVGLVVALAIFLWRSPRKAQAIGVLAAIAVAAVVTGALDVIGARIDNQGDEFSSFSSAGSGRGEIWSVAFDAWSAGGPPAWTLGTGLRSIPVFELRALGSELIGHSDIVEVLVQLGFFAFVAWVAIWVGLLRARMQPIVLLPILVFGVVNGSLEYVAPLTAGIFLAAACAERPG